MASITLTPESEQSSMVEGLRKGDREAFVTLVKKWEQAMLQTAQRILQSTTDAEDVRQTILTRILERPECLPAEDHLDLWIRRCVINESLHRLRKRKCDAVARQALLNSPPDPAADPAAAVERHEQVSALSRALATLSPEQRAMLSLRFDDGLTIREIAETLQLPPTTAYDRLKNIIRLLRSQLHEEERGAE
jgi:RNA polymerase sigma-70 factor (ECF subfamily)